MATIKSYTDIEQSRKLAEILPIKSADMHSEAKDINGDMVFIVVSGLGDKTKSNYGSPVWSLTAMLDVLEYGALFKTSQGWICQAYYIGLKSIMSNYHSNPVDACYEMIIHLYELNLL